MLAKVNELRERTWRQLQRQLAEICDTSVDGWLIWGRGNPRLFDLIAHSSGCGYSGVRTK